MSDSRSSSETLTTHLRLFQSTLDRVREGVVIVDTEGALRLVNPAARRLLGELPPEAGLSSRQDYCSLVDPKSDADLPLDEWPLSKALKGIQTDETELILRTPTGTDTLIGASASPLLSEAGTLLGASTVFTDLSGSKAADYELRRAKEAAESEARKKLNLLAKMSHEIRTPMTAVLGFADLLLDPDLGYSGRLNYVQTIRRNGDHLLSLINDILDFTKMETGEIITEQVECPLHNILFEVASTMRARAKDKGLEFTVHYETPIPNMIHGDPTHLRQILYNLLSNAIKFTRRGNVGMTARCIRLEENLSRIEVEVSDTGIGMNREEVDALFQAFRQANSSTTREFGGTGLGLAITRPLAQELNGDIRVSSVPNEGSVFTLYFDLELDSDTEYVAQPNAYGSESAASLSNDKEFESSELKGRVLLAEDGVDNQILIAHMLRSRGFEVQIAADGESAVEQARTAIDAGDPYDVVLMDMQMPVLDGYGAASRLRRHGYANPIIALTAHALPGERERCIAAGCNDYLSKPIRRDLLVQTVVNYMTMENADVAVPDESRTVADNSLRSEFADDPELGTLVAGFIESLPERLSTLQVAAREGELDSLCRLAHQLKGAAGGYGFPELSEAAEKLETSAKQSESADEAAEKIAELSVICDRIARGATGGGAADG